MLTFTCIYPLPNTY